MSALAILCCSPAFLPAESHGGVPQSTYALCKALTRAGANVKVVTTDRNGTARLDVIKDRWTEFDGLSVWYARSSPGPFLYAASAGEAIGSVMPQVDCVMSSGTLWGHSGWLAWRDAKRHHKPAITYVRGLLDPWAFGYKAVRKTAYWRLIGRRIVEESAAIVALTEAERDALQALKIKARIEVIPNGAPVPGSGDDAPFDRAWLDANYPALAGRRYVLFLGRVHEIKAIDVLLEAIALFQQRRADVAFVIAGPIDRAYARRWRELVTAHRLEHTLVLPGTVSGSPKATWLRHADLFVLPSYSEGLPVSVLEALASGVPAVVSQGCHLPEIQESGAGMVIESKPDALVTAMASILADEPRRQTMSDRARLLAATTFDWEAIARRTLALCREVIGASSGGR